MLGYRNSPAGPRMLRLWMTCPARSRSWPQVAGGCGCPAATRAAGSTGPAGSVAATGPRRCGPVGAADPGIVSRLAHPLAHPSEIVHIPFRRLSVIGADIVASPRAAGLGITASVLGVAIGLLSSITILRRLRVPTTVGRSRGRQGVHSGTQGAAGDHMRKIMATMIAATVVIIFVLVGTKAGHTIDAATQHFMLYYAGVLALVGLTGSVLVSLLATDRIVMTPGHRVMAQAVHRAFAFGTLAFLIIHITTEILAQRSHVIDAFIPFLSPYRTFYIGLGTIAADLIVLLVVTEHPPQAVHRARQGLALAGHSLQLLRGVRVRGPARAARRTGGQAVRRLELRVRDRGDRPRSRGQVPGHLAAAEGKPRLIPQRRPGQALGFFAAARRGHEHGAGTARRDGPGAARRPGRARRRHRRAGHGRVDRASGAGRVSASGPLPALGSRSGLRRAICVVLCRSSASPGAYRDLGFTPLGAPPYGDDVPTAMRGRPYLGVDQPRSALAGPARVPRDSRSTSPGMTGRLGSRGRPGDTATCLRTNCPPTHTDRRAVGRSPRRRMSTTTQTVPDPPDRRVGRVRWADRFAARLAGVRASPGGHNRTAPSGGPELGADANARDRPDAPARNRADAPS